MYIEFHSSIFCYCDNATYKNYNTYHSFLNNVVVLHHSVFLESLPSFTPFYFLSVLSFFLLFSFIISFSKPASANILEICGMYFSCHCIIAPLPSTPYLEASISKSVNQNEKTFPTEVSSVFCVKFHWNCYINPYRTNVENRVSS